MDWSNGATGIDLKRISHERSRLEHSYINAGEDLRPGTRGLSGWNRVRSKFHKRILSVTHEVPLRPLRARIAAFHLTLTDREGPPILDHSRPQVFPEADYRSSHCGQYVSQHYGTPFLKAGMTLCHFTGLEPGYMKQRIEFVSRHDAVPLRSVELRHLSKSSMPPSGHFRMIERHGSSICLNGRRSTALLRSRSSTFSIRSRTSNSTASRG